MAPINVFIDFETYKTGQSVNSFLNDNSQQVFTELKPELSKQVGSLVRKVMNDALSALPAEKFLVRN